MLQFMKPQSKATRMNSNPTSVQTKRPLLTKICTLTYQNPIAFIAFTKMNNHMMIYPVMTQQQTFLPPLNYDFRHTNKHQVFVLITLMFIVNPSLAKQLLIKQVNLLYHPSAATINSLLSLIFTEIKSLPNRYKTTLNTLSKMHMPTS